MIGLSRVMFSFMISCMVVRSEAHSTCKHTYEHTQSTLTLVSINLEILWEALKNKGLLKPLGLTA